MEAPPLERKLVAVLAADVEGYSRAMHRDEEATLLTLSSHRQIIDDLIGKWHGRITGTAGDSVLAEFASVINAVNCAVAIQQALHAANVGLAEERRLLFRIGINVGDVMVKDGDIFGDGVNIAARLETLAEPGGICVTRGVRDHLRDRASFVFRDLGEQSVKNIARPVRAYRVLFDPAAPPHVLPIAEQASDRPQGVELSPASDDPAFELAFWEAAQRSGEANELRAYLDRYPNGAFVALAEARLTEERAALPSPEDRAV
ncbi:MAG TPA: adenylate/guanylate cyclase domain-containing protein, partial [Candidatus Sulfotelmatobacter sp.]|nr:adenylate/guanylate cyclase domain-containing protein [Candidatus Sulfotelmatobacter sp.]